jgi:hypothetical protein
VTVVATLDVVIRTLTVASTCVVVGLLPVGFFVLRPAGGVVGFLAAVAYR